VPDEQRSPQAKAIFDQAAEIASRREREAYLDRACAGDPNLRRRVDTLLRALDEASGFLEVPAAFSPETAESDVTPPGSNSAPSGDAPTSTGIAAVDSTEASDPQQAPGSPSTRSTREGPGSLIGVYKLLERIGEGGMGAVYLAEQERPVRRKVALKVIKPGMDTEQVVARFEAERQALAIMDHPSIAKVFDAGVTDTGRPYFVMELVKGVPITEYCDAVHLTPKERLELFIPVCQAIQHAHQKGIIHRDIKPSNVLVAMQDGKPVPKVIDFGIAKAIDQRLTEKTFFTQHGAIIGTLEYMSPEQAEISAMDIDTRADIYALGVLLYELLTGSTPLERVRLREAGYSEILRRIREEEPPKPSTRLSESRDSLPSVAASRKTEPARLTRLLRGDLDWIVMKALEKDRTRRYESANGIARDIERHLLGDPVEAGPPSALYRLRKLARKHRAGLITAAVVLLCLIGGIAGTTLGLFEAKRQTSIAEGERQKAQDRLIKIEKINRQLDESARLEGKANVDLKEANTQVQRRFDLAMEAIKTFHTGVTEDVLLTNDNLKPVRDRLLKSAAEFYERLKGQLSGQSDRKSRQALGQAYYEIAELAGKIGAQDAAIASHRQALAVFRGLIEDSDVDGNAKPKVGQTLLDLGYLLAETGRTDEARKCYQEARMFLESLSRDYPAVDDFRRELANSHNQMGILLSEIGMPEEALACHMTAKAIRQKLADAKPDVNLFQSDLAASHNNIANLLGNTGKPFEALESFKAARAIQQRLADSNPTVTQARSALAGSHNNIARLLSEIGKPREAIDSYNAARAILAGLTRANPSITEFQRRLAISHDGIGSMLSQTGKAAEARESFDAAAKIWKGLATANPGVTQFQSDLARTYTNAGNRLHTVGDSVEALAAFRSAQAILQTLADSNPTVTEFQNGLASIHNNIGLILRVIGKPEAALASLKAALAIRQNLADANPSVTGFHSQLSQTHSSIGNLVRQFGRPKEAIVSLEAARAIQQRLADANPAVIYLQTTLAEIDVSIGILLKEIGKPEAALAPLKVGLSIHQRLADSNPTLIGIRTALANNLLEIGDVFRLAGRLREARSAYESALSIIERAISARPRLSSFLQAFEVFGLKGLGATQQSAGEIGEAVTSWRRAIASDQRHPTQSNETLYFLACCHALLGGISDTPGSGLLPAQGASELDTAMAVLKGAIEGGYRNIIWMKRDPDLDPLRSRRDFKALILDLEFPREPFSTD
jgi:eukaryotic-like serine/threonine-protein kinase